MMTVQAVELPQMEVLNRVLELPIVELAIAKSAVTYFRVKGCHQLIHWILSTAETSLSNATKQAVPIAAPFAKRFETPIHFVDHTLCLGLDKIEEKVPIVKETPHRIMENAYTLALETVRPAVSTITYANDLIIAQANNLKDISWNKVNRILDTHYGTAAIHGFDSTATIVDNLIDKYFPSTGIERVTVPASIEEDKLLHTLQTVGRLSNKAASRVYSHVIRNLRTINKDAVNSYVRSVAEILQLTQYLYVARTKGQCFAKPSEENARHSCVPNS